MTEPQIQKVEKLPEAARATETSEDVAAGQNVASEQLNRPDQPGFDPAERTPFNTPRPGREPKSPEAPAT